MWYGRDAPDKVARHLNQVEHRPVPPELSMMFPELNYTRKTRRCVGPTRASFDPAAHNPDIGASDRRNRLFPDTSRSRESEDENRGSSVSASPALRFLRQRTNRFAGIRVSPSHSK